MLRIDTNRLSHLPASIPYLPLKHLSLGYNPVEDLPEGKYLDTLEHLGLSHTHLQAIPSVLSAATRLAYLDISENDFVIQANDLQWLSVNLQRNSHLKPRGQFGNEFEMDNCIGCCPEMLDADDPQHEEALAGGEHQGLAQLEENHPINSEPFADLDQSSSDEDEVMAPDGG